jgi:hypothetical protein
MFSVSPIKQIVANILATIVLVVISESLIWCSPINLSNQYGLSIGVLIIVLYCWYTWQPRERGNETIRTWTWQAIIFLGWIFVLPLILSLIYRLPYVELFTFNFEAVKKVDYIGRLLLVVGPPMLMIALTSMLRGIIIQIMEKISPDT